MSARTEASIRPSAADGKRYGTAKRRSCIGRRAGRDSGLTLIELLVTVTLVLTLIVILVAASALRVARRGFTSVDAVGQLQDNARFATDIIQKIATQSGYLDAPYAVETQGAAIAVAGMDSVNYVQGYDNAINPLNAVGVNGVNGNRAGSCATSAGTACHNGSDILVVRSQANGAPDRSKTNNTMINCKGDTVDQVPQSRTELAVSVLHVRVGNDDEPSLSCSVGTTVSMDPQSEPLVQGVESFQVLYGVDGVAPNAKTPATSPPDSVAERYLRADQMVVGTDANATRENWQRVRSLRIGMVLRGPPGSAQDRSLARTFYPLGEEMSSADDVGTRFLPAKDGRLRLAVAFTVHLHNRQSF